LTRIDLIISFIVRGVRAIKELFGSDSYKSTKFGPEVDNAVYICEFPDHETP